MTRASIAPSLPDFDGAMPPMSDEDFAELRAIVHRVTGIALADSKRTMLASRITTRLREIGMRDFASYRARLKTKEGFAAEQQALINAVTTNKTSFFREGHQFEFMAKHVVPGLIERSKSGGRQITIWSAACSTGQEPWTIAMTLAESLPSPETWQVRILATDIDTNVLAGAERAVYKAGDLEGLSTDRLTRFFDRDRQGNAKVKESLKRWVTFRQLNFIDDAWPIKNKFDFIMCRNASIYFDLPTQKKLFTRLVDHLVPTGWLFVGHAEVLHWMNERIEAKPGGIYHLRGAGGVTAPTPSAPRPSAPALSRPAPLPPRAAPPPVPRASSPRSPRSPGAEDNLEVVNINVGEAHTSDKPVEIKTILGSCVAACLYDPVAKIGGMNHFLLPKSDSAQEMDRQRFGTHAMETLINSLMKKGAERSRLKGKLFGGGNVLANITRRPTVGEQNAAFAEEFLRKEGISLVTSRLGGDTGVEVRFHPHNGRAFVRDISRESIDLTREETQTMPTLPSGDAELF